MSLGGAEFDPLLGAALVTLCHSPWQQTLGEGQSAVGGAWSTAALIYAHTCCNSQTHTHMNKTCCIYYILLSTSLFEMIFSGCWENFQLCHLMCSYVFIWKRERERACDTVWAPDRPEEFRWVWTVSFFHTLFYMCTHTHIRLLGHLSKNIP